MILFKKGVINIRQKFIKLCKFIIHPIQNINNYLKIKKYVKCIRCWRENPDVFCKEYLGIELFEYQKRILKKNSKRRD